MTGGHNLGVSHILLLSRVYTNVNALSSLSWPWCITLSTVLRLAASRQRNNNNVARPWLTTERQGLVVVQ